MFFSRFLIIEIASKRSYFKSNFAVQSWIFLGTSLDCFVILYVLSSIKLSGMNP